MMPFMKWPSMSYSAIILVVFNTFLGGSITRTPSRNYARLGLIIWMLSTFVLRCPYSGNLFNILQAQMFTTPVDTIRQFIEYNYTIYASLAYGYEILNKSVPSIRKQ